MISWMPHLLVEADSKNKNKGTPYSTPNSTSYSSPKIHVIY